MTPIAIVFLVVSAALLWGGLVWSLLRLRKHPDIPDAEEVPPST